MGELEEVTDGLARLIALDELTPASVGEVLKVTLLPVDCHNPNLVCHDSAQEAEPWKRVALMQPAQPGGKIRPHIWLEAVDNCTVTRDDVRDRFGVGELSGTNPHRLPLRGGVVSFDHPSTDRTLRLDYSVRGGVLVGAYVGSIAPDDERRPRGDAIVPAK